MEIAVEVRADRDKDGVAFQVLNQPIGSRRGSILGATPLCRDAIRFWHRPHRFPLRTIPCDRTPFAVPAFMRVSGW